MKIKTIALEFLGWYGATVILLAYGLVSFRILQPDSLVALLLNGTGAAGIVLETLAKKDFQPALLNLIWMIIATIGLIRTQF